MARSKHAAATATPTDGGNSSDDEHGGSQHNKNKRSLRKQKTKDDCPDENDALRLLVEELKTEVEQQRSIISTLTTRLNFVLSMFGADDALIDGPKKVQSVSANPAEQPSETTRIRDQASFQESFRGAVLSAVYSDKKQQESRAKNVIVSGLPISSECDDKTVVKQLCEEELDIVPDIHNCKRLGRVMNGRCQPILVSLSSAEHASQLLSSAKKLRRSANALIKDNVYINAHLTKGQAAAAYQLRCQKRQTRAQRVGLQSATASCATSDGSSATDNSSANISSTILSADAANFVPVPTH